jgi:hypothetical protein
MASPVIGQRKLCGMRWSFMLCFLCVKFTRFCANTRVEQFSRFVGLPPAGTAPMGGTLPSHGPPGGGDAAKTGTYI